MYYNFACWHNGTALVSIYRRRTYQEKNDVFMLIHYNYIKNNDLRLYRVVCRRYINVAEWCYMKTKEGKPDVDMCRHVGMHESSDSSWISAIPVKISRYQGRTCFIEFVFHPEYGSMTLLVACCDDHFDCLCVCYD